jgi:hypothetical protein
LLLLLLLLSRCGALQDLALLQTVFSAKPWRQLDSSSSSCRSTLAFLFRTRAEAKTPAAGHAAADAESA